MNIREEIANLILKRREVLLNWLCAYYPLDTELMDKYRNDINWTGISRNKKLNWDVSFIDKRRNRLSFHYLSKNPSLPWSIDMIERYPELWDEKENLSGNTGLPWGKEFIRFYDYAWNWHYLTMNSGIIWSQDMLIEFDLFHENLSRMNGSGLWTREFLIKHADKLNWGHLTYNTNINWTVELIDSLKPFWRGSDRKAHHLEVTPWRGLSQNHTLKWSSELIERYIQKPLLRPNGFNWMDLSRNEGLPFQDGLLEKYEDKWDWKLLSGNSGVRFTAEQIDKYEDRLNWNDSSPRSLSANTSIEWSEKLLDKHIDRWDWYQIGLNEGVPWTDEMVNKYGAHLDLDSVLANRRLPWDFEMVYFNEESVFKAWKYLNEEDQEWFFDKIFAPHLDDELVEEIFFKMTNPFHLIKQSKKDDQFTQFSKSLLGKEVSLPLNEECHSDLLLLNDRVKSAIARVCAHEGKDSLIVSDFLSEYRKWQGYECGTHITELLNYYIDEIVVFFARRGDLEYMTDVVRRHNKNLQQYYEFRARGGHISHDFSYLHQCIKLKGQKALGLTRFLISMEDLREYLENTENDLPF